MICPYCDFADNIEGARVALSVANRWMTYTSSRRRMRSSEH